MIGLRYCLLSSVTFGFSACQIVPPPPQAGDVLVCFDPIQLTAGIDYLCGNEVVIVASLDPDFGTLQFTPFAFERPGETVQAVVRASDADISQYRWLFG